MNEDCKQVVQELVGASALVAHCNDRFCALVFISPLKLPELCEILEDAGWVFVLISGQTVMFRKAR